MGSRTFVTQIGGNIGFFFPLNESRTKYNFVVYGVFNGLENVHPEIAFIAVGNFNRANMRSLTKILPVVNRLLTIVIPNYEIGTSLSPPALGKSDHTSILLSLFTFKTVKNISSGSSRVERGIHYHSAGLL